MGANGKLSSSMLAGAVVMSGKRATWSDVTAPVGYDWDSGMTIQRSGSRFRVWDPVKGHVLDPADYAPEYANTYYVSMTGNDAAAGTAEAPLRKIKTALAKSGVVRVIILDQGPYDQDTGWAGYSLLKSAVVIGHPLGTIVSGHYSDIVWALDDPGNPHVYHATQTAAGDWAFDAAHVDAKGDYTQLAIQTSAANVEANPGSIYKNGDEFYVRLIDDRPPDNDVRISVLVSNNMRINPTTNGTYSLYVENLFFYGTATAGLVRAATGKTVSFYAKNCHFKYANTTDNLSLQGNAVAYLLNCVTAWGNNDGFNHLGYQENAHKYIEINCKAYENGLTGRDDNGSTAHTGSTGIRVNGEYSRSVGRTIQDITGSKSWLLGCKAYNPKIGTTGSDGLANRNFAVGDAGGTAAEMWLDTCRSYGAVADLDVFANALMHVHNLASEGTSTVDPAGTLDTY
jgi:hypothetical protein